MKTYTTIYSVDVVGTMAQPLSPYASEIRRNESNQ